MERTRRLEAQERGKPKGGQGDDEWWQVKGLSTGLPLTQGQAERTPQEGCLCEMGREI